MSPTSPTNDEQITYWNEVSGPKWVELADAINDQIEPLGRETIERAAVVLGERVLDVGCGCGHTSLELAGRVGAEGRVLGVDISAPMLADARARAERWELGNVSFLEADAQVHAFEPGGFDLVYSRFGVMFFADPTTAFANLRRALDSRGRIAFICWQALGRNPWMLVPAMAAAQHVEMVPPSDPHAPGPFAFADDERVRGILEGAGFADVRIEASEGTLAVGRDRTLEQIVGFLQNMGPAGRALQGASPDVREKVGRSMREALEPYFDGTAVRMDYAAWIARGRAG